MSAIHARHTTGRRTSRSALTSPVLGLPRVSKGARLTGEDRAKFDRAVIEAYTGEQQPSIRQIAEETGRAFATIQGILTSATVALRPRGGSRTP
ncbi:helix-turn-helix domain-containing protein [Streptomyces sp. NPDC097617]|uniref:helix-turn-helix domain-containing protein n=1 Tax=Streptomyces sp. NPDC097617 TaxID=3366091 RepID=UPI0038135422